MSSPTSHSGTIFFFILAFSILLSVLFRPDTLLGFHFRDSETYEKAVWGRLANPWAILAPFSFFLRTIPYVVNPSSLFNPTSSGGSFMAQKTNQSSPLSAFPGLKTAFPVSSTLFSLFQTSEFPFFLCSFFATSSLLHFTLFSFLPSSETSSTTPFTSPFPNISSSSSSLSSASSSSSSSFSSFF